MCPPDAVGGVFGLEVNKLLLYKKKQKREKQRCVYIDCVFGIKEMLILKPFFSDKAGIENHSQKNNVLTV